MKKIRLKLLAFGLFLLVLQACDKPKTSCKKEDGFAFTLKPRCKCN
jgi:hypothetical protein